MKPDFVANTTKSNSEHNRIKIGRWARLRFRKRVFAGVQLIERAGAV